MREKRFDRGAWLTLVLTLFILLFGLSIPLIQFNLPTDGWLTTLAANSAENIVYTADLLGVNTGLQISDLLVAVEDVSVSQLGPDAFPTDRLAAGDVIALTVQRGSDQVQVNVTMAHWTWKAIASYYLGNAGRWLNGLTGLVLLVVGFYVFLNRPRYPAAQALLVLNTVMTLMFSLWGLVPNSIANVVIPAMTLYTDLSNALIFSLLFPPALIRFGLVFPRLKRSIERHPALQFFPYAVGLVVFTAPRFLDGLWLLPVTWTYLALLLTVSLLVHSALTARDSVSRAQIKWGILGAVLGLGLFLLSFLSLAGLVAGAAGTILGIFGSLGSAVFGAALGIAILRYRLFDIDLIIRKTLVYSALTGTLALVFFGGVAMLQQVVGRLTGTENSPFVIVISTLLIAALFAPLRRGIQDFIDRRFYRQKYNAEQALEAFAVTARSETDLEALTAKLAEVVSQTMQPMQVSVWMRINSGRRSNSRLSEIGTGKSK